jgi:hypothetical protein
MPRTTIQPDGRVTYRTSLFSILGKAQSFARCLQSNSSRFERVMIDASETSKTPKWFVTFEPKSESRKDAIHAGQQEARQIRAEQQEFIFWPSDRRTMNGDPLYYWCFSVESGETYEVSIGDCTCWDYFARCQCSGLRCKHMIARSNQIADGTIGQTDKKTISREEITRRMNEDY